MSIKYDLLQRKLGFDKLKEPKYYAVSRSAGTLDFESLCQTIADRGTVIKGDAMAVIDGLLFVMCQGLREGKIIDLGEFGRFQMSLHSEGTLTRDEFTNAKITGSRIIFRPGLILKDMVKTLKYVSTGLYSDLPEEEGGGEADGGATGNE